MLAFLDTIQPPDLTNEPPLASPDVTLRMDVQTAELQSVNEKLVEQNLHMLEMLQLNRDRITVTQIQHDAEIENQSAIGGATIEAIEGLDSVTSPPS